MNKLFKTYYAFTAIINTHFPSVGEYEDWVDMAKKKRFEVDMYRFELDCYGKLHIHGIGTAKSNYYYKQLNPKGWSTRITEIGSENDLKIWLKYCNKDYVNDDLQDQMLWGYMVRHGMVDYLKEGI